MPDQQEISEISATIVSALNEHFAAPGPLPASPFGQEKVRLVVEDPEGHHRSFLIDIIERPAIPENYDPDSYDPQLLGVQDLIAWALACDGGHHKQWFIEKIAERLGMDLSGLGHEPGIAP